MHSLLVTLVTLAGASLLGFVAVICAMAAKHPDRSRPLTLAAKTLYAVMVVSGLSSGAVAISMDNSGRDALVRAIEGKYDVTVPADVAERRDLASLNPWTIDGRDYLCRIDGPTDVEELQTADPVLECVATDEVVEFSR